MDLRNVLLVSLFSSALAQVELAGTGNIWALEGENWLDVRLDDSVGCLSARAHYTTNNSDCGVYSFSNNTLSAETGVCTFADPSAPEGPGRGDLKYAMKCTSEGEYDSYIYSLNDLEGYPFLWIGNLWPYYLAERPEPGQEGLIWTKGITEVPPELISLVLVWDQLSE